MLPLPPELGRLLIAQAGCVAADQLHDLGVDVSNLGRLARQVGLTRLSRQVYRLADQPPSALAAAWGAYLALEPDHRVPGEVAVSHRSAFCLYVAPSKEPAWPKRLQTDHVTVPASFVGRNRSGVRLHRSVVPLDIQMFGTLPVTSAVRTGIDLARLLAPAEGLAALDALVSTGTAPLAFTAALPAFDEITGVVKARTLIGLTAPGVDSPPESRLRWLLVDSGLPRPDVDLRIHAPDGSLAVRGELGYEEWLVWLEYDGFEVHSSRSAFRYDRSKTQWLQARGWSVVRCSDVDLRNPGQLVRLVQHELRIAPGRIEALPHGLSPEADAAKARILPRHATQSLTATARLPRS